MRVRQAVVVAFLVLAGVSAAVGGWLVARALDGGAGSVETETVLSNLELPVLDGAVDGPARRRGEIVVLDFWASWCTPCHVQSKILSNLVDQYSGRVRFFAINVGESEQIVRDSLEQHPISFPVLLDLRGESASRAGIVGMPTLVILDGEGSVALRRTGLTSARFLRTALDELLTEVGSVSETSFEQTSGLEAVAKSGP